jgi:hypothetical protein
MTSRNDELFEQSQKVIPGGVNSPVRAFRSVGGTPRFFARGAGQPGLGRRRQVLHRLRRLLGAADPRPRRPGRGQGGAGHRRPGPVLRRADRKRELSMAELLTQLLPSMEKLRLVSSGTEATMSAIRLARGFTGRDCWSSSKAATTATPTACWSRPAPACSPSVRRVPPACRPIVPAHPGARLQRHPSRSTGCSPSAATRSPASSSSRWPAT